jgi:hypothetical protein
MDLKVNNGHSFIHPISGVIIGPGHFYEDYEASEKKTTRRRKNEINEPSTPVVKEGENEDGSGQSDSTPEGRSEG